MPGRSLRGALALACIAALTAAGLAAAQPAVFELGNLVVTADGGFRPRLLPKHRFAPIDFVGRVQMATKAGGPPPPLEHAVVEFDRQGRLDVAGLPSCPPQRIAQSSPARARRLCRGAIVGEGSVRAAISLPTGWIAAASPLTVFNGPRQDGHPTVILHAQTQVPAPETYATVVPIEPLRGPFSYRATFDVPEIAQGLGSITEVSLRVGRHYRAGGRERSYVAARCTVGVLRTHGRLAFGDGTVIEGNVEKPCTSR